MFLDGSVLHSFDKQYHSIHSFASKLQSVKVSEAKQHEIHESISGLDHNSEPDLFLDIQNEPNLFKDDFLLDGKEVVIIDSDLPHEVNCAKLSSPSLCMTKPSNCKNPEVMTEVDPSECNKPEEDPEPELENDEEDKQEVDEDLDEDCTGAKSKRRDVILKTLLRKCRKYFQKLFNNHTKFLKNKKKELSCYYKSCIEKFIQECLPLDTTLNIGFHMGALLYPQEMIRCVDKFVYPNGIKTSSRKKLMKKKISTYKDQVDILHDILYKFSKEKLEKFIAIPELAIIFLYFIENSNECNSTDIETKICKELMTKCKKTLKSSKKSKGVATLFDPCGADE